MKEKYVDEKLDSPLFVFGKHPDNGLVDIASPSDDTLISGISEESAEKIMAHNEKLMDIIYQVNKIDPKILEKIFYGEEPTYRESTRYEICVVCEPNRLLIHDETMRICPSHLERVRNCDHDYILGTCDHCGDQVEL